MLHFHELCLITLKYILQISQFVVPSRTDGWRDHFSRTFNDPRQYSPAICDLCSLATKHFHTSVLIIFSYFTESHKSGYQLQQTLANWHAKTKCMLHMSSALSISMYATGFQGPAVPQERPHRAASMAAACPTATEAMKITVSELPQTSETNQRNTPTNGNWGDGDKEP